MATRQGRDHDLRRQLEPGAAARDRALPRRAARRAPSSARFSDGEIQVEIHGERPRRRRLRHPVDLHAGNDHLMELLLMLDALKRASAGRITAVDPVLRLRAPGPQGLSARADQRQARRRSHRDRGRLARPHDGSPRRPDPGLLQHPRRQPLRDAGAAARTCASAAAGRRGRGRDLARRRRRRARARVREAARAATSRSSTSAARAQRGRRDEHHRRGDGPRIAIIIDDMVDTAGTHRAAAADAATRRRRAGGHRAAARTRVLSGPAIERLEASPLDELIVTDTIPLRDERAHAAEGRVLSVAH